MSEIMAKFRFCPLLLRVAVLLLICASLSFGTSIIVQPILIGTSTGTLESIEALYADVIYDQIGLNVTFLTETLISSYAGTTLVDNATANMTSSTINEFLSDVSWYSAPIITVWYVDSITSPGVIGTIRGMTIAGVVGGELRFGILVSLATNAYDTLGHELAHVLTWYISGGSLYFTCADTINGCVSGDSSHDANPYNLLAPGSTRILPASLSDIGTVDQITASQAGFMLAHTDFVVPEPGSLALIGSGMLLLWFARGRRAA